MKWSYRGVWREERPGDSVEVGESELDTGVGEAQLVYVAGGVPGTDVALSWERGDCDGVFQLRLRKVVRNSSIHVTLINNDKTQIFASAWAKFLAISKQRYFLMSLRAHKDI